MQERTGGASPLRSRIITYTKVVGLSHVIRPEMPRWPGDPAVEFSEEATAETHGFYLRRFSMGEHSGTHMNAPRTFDPQGAGVDVYAPGELVVPAIVIDLRTQATANPDIALTPEDILAWEERYGLIPTGGMALLYTGCQHKWEDPTAYLGLDSQGGLHFPGFGSDAARLLVEERGVAGLGTDAAGVEPGQDDSFSANRLVLAKGGIVLECLDNLDQLPATGATLVIGPLRLEHGSGAPASVLALVP
ncbi:MAG: cyclase [SAR202 cluster bacterium Io17-Chloro-G9]|nr:MAG: cyclase [SAR202 cluster bacterium Io17-Chloro-G9]